jgi:lipoprotein NlpD
LAGEGARGARPALLALLALLGAAGCAAPRATASASVAPVESSPVELGELRDPHPEPELISVRHRVAPGETLYRISRAYRLTVEELSEANGITDPRTLAVGQELVIPGVEQRVAVEPSPTASPGRAEASRPSGSSAGSRPVAVSPPASRAAPRKPSEHPAPKTKGTLDWPLRGVLYARFGKKGREPHDGIDLAAPVGTPIKTAQAGEVLYAGEQRGYGLIVIIRHSEQLITLYAHNRDLRVRTGQKVRRGQVIATVGESGKTSGPQLHFEVRQDGRPVDPLDFLGPLPSS